MDFDIIKNKAYTVNLTKIAKSILVHYLELNQLADYIERYSQEPINPSREYLETWNYNKELDAQRTIFDEVALKTSLLHDLCILMGQITTLAYQQRPDINFGNLNKMLKDSVTAKIENVFLWNPGMALAALRQFFTPTHEFIPKILSDILLEQIFKCVLDLCVQFKLPFKKGWDACCEGII